MLKRKLLKLLGIQQAKPAAPGLPVDFPGREALQQAGFKRLEDVPLTAASLKKVPGITWLEITMIGVWRAKNIIK